VAREVISLHAAVKQLEEEASKPDSVIGKAGEHTQKELQNLVQNVGQILDQLDKLVSKYKSLGTTKRSKRDVIRFSTESLEDIRSNVILHTTALNLFLGALSTASLGRIESKLDEIVKELRNGQRDFSTIAVSDDEDDPVAKRQWRALREELIEDGFQKDDVDDHKAWIKAQMRKRITDGKGGPLECDETADKIVAISSSAVQTHAPGTQIIFPSGISMDADDPTTEDEQSSPLFFCTGYPPCNLGYTKSEHLARHMRKHTGDRPFSCHCGRRFSRMENLRQHAQRVHRNEEISKDSPTTTLSGLQRQLRTTVPYRSMTEAPQVGRVDETGGNRTPYDQNILILAPNDRYQPEADSGSGYGFPVVYDSPTKLRRSPSVSSITSIHSDVSEHDSHCNLMKRTVTTTTTTYYSASATDESAASDLNDISSPYKRSPGISPRSEEPLNNAPGPQSMMGPFASTSSSSSQKNHVCKVCYERFTRPSSLQTHMYSHTGEKPFACTFAGCGRRFSVVSNFRRHKKVHKG
jgi:hypothetical protein